MGARSGSRVGPNADKQICVGFNTADSVHCFEAGAQTGVESAFRISDSPGKDRHKRNAGISQWSCAMIQDWVIGMGLESIASRFDEEAIDGEALLECCEEDFIALGVDKLGDRRRLMKQIRLKQAEEAELETCAQTGFGRSPQTQQHHQHAADGASHSALGSHDNHSNDDQHFTLDDDGVSVDEAYGHGFTSKHGRDGQPPSPHSNAPSCDNPLVPANRYMCHGDDPDRGPNLQGSTGKGKGASASSKGDGKNSNFTSNDNPLASGNRWGDVRGLPDRPPVFGSCKERFTWKDDPGPKGKAN
jgi:hypothetical protein